MPFFIGYQVSVPAVKESLFAFFQRLISKTPVDFIFQRIAGRRRRFRRNTAGSRGRYDQFLGSMGQDQPCDAHGFCILQSIFWGAVFANRRVFKA